MYVYAPKKKRAGFKKVFVTVLIASAAYGGYRAWDWYDAEYRAGHFAEAATTAVETAREHLAAGEIDKARDALEAVVARVEGHGAGLQALLLLGKIEQAHGSTDAALGYYRRAIDKFPTNPERPRAAIAYARLLEESGRNDEAYAVYNQVHETAPPELRAAATTALGRRLEKQDDLASAREYYQRAVNEAKWRSEDWEEAVDRLGRLNVQFLFSPEPAPDSSVYTVSPGDSLTSIGMELNVTMGQLARANNIDDPSRLRVGQQLKYTPKDFRIIIERSTCRLYLLDRNGIFKVYPIGLGMPGHETTLGSYTIGNKQKDPAWFKPGVGEIPPGAPDNELGTRWMPLVPAREGLPTDLGIHGTIAPESIGGYTSHGCARMYKEDVEELYDIVVRATPVEIVEVLNPQDII